MMWLLVGLGNPGEKYRRNRHNIGFMAVEAIADHFGFAAMRAKFQGLFSEGRIGQHKVVVLEPQTYMNESGRSVRQVCDFYKIETSRIVVFHDELDLEPGKIRIKAGGGNAGHNGLKSMQAHLGSPDFIRVRMGIGHPGDKDRVSPYVLGDFSKAEMEWVEPLNKAIARHAGLLVDGRHTDFMSKVAMEAPSPLKKEDGQNEL